jgi:cell wall assembly regulator SMI1
MALPAVVTRTLTRDVSGRPGAEVAHRAFADLGTPLPADFREFYEAHEGGFGSRRTGFELYALCERSERIVNDTRIAREVHSWPARFLVLTQLLGNGVLVLDASTGRVYDVDFEGSDQELLRGTLEPRWGSFSEFLDFYFSDPP